MRSDRIDRLHLCPGFWGVPPIMELNLNSRVICHPFADESLRGDVAAMAIYNQYPFEPLLRQRVENVTHYRHVGFQSKGNRPRKRAEIRCDAVGEDRKYRNF